MARQILSIARNTFTESIRQPIFVILLGGVMIMLLLAISLSAYTLDDDNKLMIDMGLSMCFVGGLALAAFTASGVLAREIENKTALTVISKPIGRPAFVLGKYLGVSAALSLAFWIWALMLLMLVRHKVLSAAYMSADAPVVSFMSIALAAAFVVAVWGNFFYGWVFASNFSGVLAATMTVAFALVLVINKDWQLQAPITEFTHEESLVGPVAVALWLVFLGVLLMASVAIASSTRAGQVVTLLVCAIVFLAGLYSDFMFGRHLATHPAAWIGYALLPNVQFLFLADAITQNHPVSGYYVGLVAGYCALYIGAVLALAVALFQTREAG